MRTLGIGLAFGITLSCAAGAARAVEPHERNGFMIGFSVGGGSVGIEDVDDREGSVTGNFRIGGALRQDLVLHFEATGWTKEFDDELGEITWTFSTGTAALTFYPGGGGTWLRGGIGFATVNVELETAGVKVSDDETGLGLVAAVGHEWRLTRKFAMGPHAEVVYMNLDDVESANQFGGALDFNWYW